jgi:predicted PurR-regulated permease PerM
MTDDHRRRSATEAVTWPMRVAAAWGWRLIVVALVIWLIGRVFLKVELVAFSFILALFFTAVLHPLEVQLRRLPGPRSVSAGVALLVGVLCFAGITLFVTWQIQDHSGELANQLTDFVSKTRNWLHDGPLHIKSSDLDHIADNITKTIKDHQGQLISGAIATVRTVIEAIGALLLILLSTFFLLRDGEQVWNWVLRLFPRGAQPKVDVAGRAGWGSLGGYVRGQVIIALFHGVSVLIILLVLRVPLAAALAVLIFLGSFVPLIGLTATGSLCVAVTLLEHGFTAGVVVAVAIIVLFQLEAHLLQPLIMSRSVELHPLAVALSVLTGTLVAGIVGALLAVPFVAFLNTTISALRASPDAAAGTTEPDGRPVEPDGRPVDLAKRPPADGRPIDDQPAERDPSADV